MKKSNKVFLFSLILLLSACSNSIGSKQDQGNQKYLYELNANLLETIDMLTVFNETSGKMMGAIEGTDRYTTFLMELTIECSRLIEQIRLGENLDPIQKEGQIELMISSLRPADIESPSSISGKMDAENQEYLVTVQDNLLSQMKTLLGEIMKEEKIILENGIITPNYYRLHSHHFLFSLLVDFIEPSELLSKKNREYLTLVTKAIEESILPPEKEPEK